MFFLLKTCSCLCLRWFYRQVTQRVQNPAACAYGHTENSFEKYFPLFEKSNSSTGKYWFALHTACSRRSIYTLNICFIIHINFVPLIRTWQTHYFYKCSTCCPFTFTYFSHLRTLSFNMAWKVACDVSVTWLKIVI